LEWAALIPHFSGDPHFKILNYSRKHTNSCDLYNASGDDEWSADVR
jgi:hypothetical protein